MVSVPDGGAGPPLGNPAPGRLGSEVEDVSDHGDGPRLRPRGAMRRGQVEPCPATAGQRQGPAVDPAGNERGPGRRSPGRRLATPRHTDAPPAAASRAVVDGDPVVGRDRHADAPPAAASRGAAPSTPSSSSTPTILSSDAGRGGAMGSR